MSGTMIAVIFRRITYLLLVVTHLSFTPASGSEATAFVEPSKNLSNTSSASSPSLPVSTDRSQINLGPALSSAATAGIALGVSFGGIALCLLAGCALARIRHRDSGRSRRVVKMEGLGLFTSEEGGNPLCKEVAVALPA